MNCRDLATEFEQVKMIDNVKRVNDIEELKKITIRLIELNFSMREQFSSMIVKGWLSNDK